MTAAQLWNIFAQAYYECPQARFYGNLEDMPTNNTIATTVAYWMNPETIGGCMLWHKGYYAHLPVTIQAMCKQYREELDKQAAIIATKVFK